MTFLNSLWRNEKSRELIIQVFVLICIGWFLSWLVANVDANFKALGKDISFEFLFIPAGYDINQYLIDYNNSYVTVHNLWRIRQVRNRNFHVVISMFF